MPELWALLFILLDGTSMATGFYGVSSHETLEECKRAGHSHEEARKGLYVCVEYNQAGHFFYGKGPDAYGFGKRAGY